MKLTAMSELLFHACLSSTDLVGSGSGVDLWINGKFVCSSVPTYKKVESRGPTETEHQTISEMSLCQIGQTLKKDDRIKFVARFDLEKYPQSVTFAFLEWRIALTTSTRRQSNTGYLEETAAGIFVTIAYPMGYELP
jgi:hypothetical protein